MQQIFSGGVVPPPASADSADARFTVTQEES